MAVQYPLSELPVRSRILGEHGEDAGRVSLPRRRLTDGETYLALSPRQARHRVEHEHHVAAPLAEVLGDGGGDEGRPQAHHRRLVRRGADHDRALHPLFAQRVLDELAHLAPALANEADHREVCLHLPGDLTHERGLAHARAGEEAHALPGADREQPVDGLDPQRQRPLDAPPQERVGAVAVHRPLDHSLPGKRPAVDGLPQAVEEPTQEPLSASNGQRAAGGRHLARRAYAGELAERHEHHLVALKADDLRLHAPAPRALHLHHLADPNPGHGRLDDQARQLRHAAAHASGPRLVDEAVILREVDGHALAHGRLRARRPHAYRRMEGSRSLYESIPPRRL